MKTRLSILFAITIALIVLCARPVPAADQTFLFASPDTKESLSDREAQARLASFEQVNATAVADRAACSLTDHVQVANGLGIYDHSSENSFILETDMERQQSEYLAALLGLYSHQEFVLLFLPERSGGDRLWIIKTPQTLDAVITSLRKWQLTPVTVRTEADQSEVWFVDLAGKRAQDVKSFTSAVQGTSSLTPGTAEMLGNQKRAAAFTAWRQQISAFERQSGRRLSEQLSSKTWRRATMVHTCSMNLATP